MSPPPYRALSFGLRLVSALIAVAGVLMIVADKPLVMRVLIYPPAYEVSTLLLVMLKELGGVMLMISAMLFLAARDPARSVAILDGLMVGLCVLSVTAMLSAKMLAGMYPAYMIWGKAVVRLALAALLYWVRPRGTRHRNSDEG
jgi:hypothetical protein